MRGRMVFLAGVLGLTVTGCSTSIDKVATYDKVPMEEAEQKPDLEKLNPEPPRTVVFKARITDEEDEEAHVEDEEGLVMALLELALSDGEPEPSGASVAREAEIGRVIADTLKDTLKVTGMEFVDPGQATQLKKRLAKAERQGQPATGDAEEVDFVIAGWVTGVSTSSYFEERETREDEDGDEYVVQQATCNYSAKLWGRIQIYEMPSLTEVKSVSITGESETSDLEDESDCPSPIVGWPVLAQQAASDAISGEKAAFRNHFSPKAYVLERRAKEGENIFKLSLGRERGFKPDSEVVIYRKGASDRSQSEENRPGESKVAKGTVTDKVGEDYAWILVEDPEQAEKVRLGHHARVQYGADGIFR